MLFTAWQQRRADRLASVRPEQEEAADFAPPAGLATGTAKG
jgi:hypothetical protein